LLDSIYVPGANGVGVPLAAIAKPVVTAAAPQIDRYDRERTVTVTAEVRTGYLTSRVNAEVAKALQGRLVVPPGYRMRFGGQAQAQAEGFNGLGAAAIIAILGIVAVLVLEFGRFRTVLVVASIIPFGLFGAVAALWTAGQSFSFTAGIGVVALIGIEVKNSILLVDFAEQLRREGMPIGEAVALAGEIRFLPVLLTSVTAIGGMLPLALEGSGLYSPLATVIIGGLVASTLLSRIATPVAYLLLARGGGSGGGSRGTADGRPRAMS
jgi:multidrug efflux pump subunit AcrB